MFVDREHILRLYAYHHWAGDRMLAAFAPITAEQLDQKWGGSFGSGRALLRHILGAEWLWNERWGGTSPTALPDYPATYAGDDFRREWDKMKAAQQRYLSGLTRDRLTSRFAWTNLKGEPSALPLSDVLIHVVNHGTYHRGQLSHLLRDLGQSPPSTDYMIFAKNG